MEYEDQISIATPEGVALTLTLAGLGSRAIALMLDWLVRIPFFIIVALIAAGTGTAGIIVLIIASFLLIYVYDVLFEAFGGGRTPGKRWTSLRVVHIDGRPEGLGTAAVRNVIRLVDWLPGIYIVGVVSIIATTRNQRLGDLAGGTIVVREPRAVKQPKPPKPKQRSAAVPAPMPIPTHPNWLPAWDVTAVTPHDIATVRTFLERRHALAQPARIELAARLAALMATKIPGLQGAPPDAEQMLETVAALKSARGR